MKNLLLVVALIVLVAPVWAATRTVTLSVPGMNCAACPITVKLALSRVDGVSKVDVNYPQREVVVTYDDSQAGHEQLIGATTNSGYPSIVKP